MRALVLAAALLATLVSACGGSSASAPRPSEGVRESPRGVVVTRANDRGTVRVRVGDRVEITLGPEFDWRVDPPDGVVLRAVTRTELPRGTQAIWSAAAAGTWDLTATGTVICPSGKACIQLAVLFTATVVVEP